MDRADSNAPCTAEVNLHLREQCATNIICNEVNAKESFLPDYSYAVPSHQRLNRFSAIVPIKYKELL